MNERLLAARLKKGWSQEEAAAAAYISVRTYQRWERGERRPNFASRRFLRAAFGATDEELGFYFLKQVTQDKPPVSAPCVKDESTTEYNISTPHLPANIASTGSMRSDSDGSKTTSSARSRSLSAATSSGMLELFCGRCDFVTPEEMAIKRRELLHLLSIAGSILLIPDVDWDHIEAALSRTLYIDTAMVNDLEAINNRCWRLFMAASPKFSVLDSVLGQLKVQVQFLKASQETQIHQRLCALVSSMSQLAGEIFFDLHDHDAAHSCYVFAIMSAKEAKAYDLWASALVRHSYLPIFNEHYEEALPLLRQAERISRRGDSTLPARYWAAATYAEAEAGIGNLRACQNAFERAYGVRDLAGESPAWVRFDGSRLPALQGACYVRLKQPTIAEPVLQQALQQGAKTDRRRAMILSDLALAALQQKNVEQACTFTDEVVTLTANSASGFLYSSVLKIWQQLAPFADTEVVRTLEERIASLALRRE